MIKETTENNGTVTEFFGAGNSSKTMPTATESADGKTVVFSAKSTEEKSTEEETFQENEETSIEKAENNNQQTNQDVSTQTTQQTATSQEEESQEEELENEKLSFKIKTEPTKTETEESKTDDTKETYVLTDESVVQYLKTKGLEVDSLNEVAKKTSLPQPVAEFEKFHNETGLGIKEFYTSNRDWNSESDESVLREYYRYQDPEYPDNEIDSLIDVISVSEDEENELSDKELQKRKLEYSTEVRKARKFMQGVSQKYKVPQTEAPKQQQRQPTAEEIAAAYRPYWDSRDKSLESLNSIKLPIENLGDIELAITQEHKDLISKHTQTQESFFSRWQDDKGAINTDKSTLDSAWGIKEIRNELLASLLEQAHVKFMEDYSKKRRNVRLGEQKQTPKAKQKGKVHEINRNSGASKKFGQPIVPLRNKK